MATCDHFDRELLERFRPELRYDRQYDYRATAVETMVENEGNLLLTSPPPPEVAGRLAGDRS